MNMSGMNTRLNSFQRSVALKMRPWKVSNKYNVFVHVLSSKSLNPAATSSSKTLSGSSTRDSTDVSTAAASGSGYFGNVIDNSGMQ